MKLNDDLEIIDLGLYIKSKSILCLTDFHIGLEEAMNKSGFLVPRFQTKDIHNRLSKIFSKIKFKDKVNAKNDTPKIQHDNKQINNKNIVNKIIILGDLKHEFGEISKQEWYDTLNVIDYLKSHCNELILIKGNHDTILGPISNKKELKLLDNYYSKEYYFCHGNVIPKKSDKNFEKAKTIIIGHEHPAITIRDTHRSEKYKCFLIGKYIDTKIGYDKNLIVLPSFNFVNEGTNILAESLLSPFLSKKTIKNFKAIIVADKLYDFGIIKEMKK